MVSVLLFVKYFTIVAKLLSIFFKEVLILSTSPLVSIDTPLTPLTILLSSTGADTTTLDLTALVIVIGGWIIGSCCSCGTTFGL